MECRPFEAAGIRTYPTRGDWDAEAVDILGSVLDRWELTPGESYTGGYAATVLSVTQEDGSPAVLKVGYPHEEALYEAVALESFPEGTAPRVLRQDPWAWAMLLERLEPGTPLSEAGLPVADGLRAGAELLARISARGPVQGIPAVGSVVHGFAASARARWSGQQERLEELGVVDLVESAIAELDDLADGGGATAMVHGDYNPGNILRSGDSWAVVDPKPMIGDPCYDLWPFVSQLGSPFDRADPDATIADHLTVAADIAGCDPVRSIRWAFARTGLNVSWYLEEGDLARAAADAAELRVWSGLRESVV